MPSAEQSPPVRQQLDFIDGLRALAALYIVVHHALQTVGFIRWWSLPLTFGREVVVVFIAISGFCLGLPLARRGSWVLDARSFYWKRIRRIFPPYYAALAIGFIVIAISAMHGAPKDYIGTPFTWPMIWAHLALVQNWMPSQFTTVDGPLWSIAIECQIYVLFPLIVMLWQRIGRWLTLFVLYFFVHLVMIFVHGGGTFFLFAFGTGVLGADLAFRPRARRWMLPGVLLSLLLLPYMYSLHRMVAYILIAIATAFLMAYYAQVPAALGSRILGWKPLAWVGTFSYSLYLVHSYVEIMGARWFAMHTLFWTKHSQAQQAATLVFLLGPLALAISYAFHCFFERPFMGAARQRAERRLLPAA